MPRYEFVEGSSSKFWEIERTGTSWTTRWGRIGTKGQEKTQHFQSVEHAEREHDKLVAEKVKKGYQRVDATPVPPPPPSAAHPQRVLTVRLEDGDDWLELILEGPVLRQCAGSGATQTSSSAERHASAAEALELHERLVSVYSRRGFAVVSRTEGLSAPEVASEAGGGASLASDAALEGACLAAAPDDARPWQVYADWLQSKGDVRGELAALLTAPSPAGAQAFARTHLTALWGELSTDPGPVKDLVARHGFYRSATLRIEQDDSLALDELTAQFLARPAARFITELHFGLAGFESDNDWGPTMRALSSSTQAGELRELYFDAYTYEDCELSWTPFGDFSKAWRSLPKLEVLHLRSGAGGTLGRLELPRLRRFIRESGGLKSSELEAIASARWPELEWLEVWTGSSDYGAEATSAHLLPFLEGKGTPKLKHLGIVNCELVPSMIGLIAGCKVLPRLEVLDLSRGVLTDREVSELVRHASAFQHLKLLDLSQNLFVDRVDELQRAFPNARLDAQRDYEGEEDDEDGARYVAVGE